MRILRGLNFPIAAVAAEGRLSLQISEVALWPPTPPETVELPDHYFVRLKVVAGGEHGHRPIIGRERGFLYLSPDGFEAFREGLKAHWQANAWDFDRLVAWAEEDFAARNALLLKEIERRQRRASEAQGITD